MAATTTPIFTNVPKLGFAKVTAADGTMDGTDADVKLVFTADATDGSFLRKLIAQPISTSGSTTTSAAELRIYLNNGSTVGTASNNQLIRAVLLPATTVNVTGTAGTPNVDIGLDIQIQAGYAVYVGVSSVAANTQWNVTSIHGDY